MHIPLPESSLDMHAHAHEHSLSLNRHPLSLDVGVANANATNPGHSTSSRFLPSSATPPHVPATPGSTYSTLTAMHPPRTPSLFSMQYSGRSHLFGAALHPEFLASVDLTEEVLGIGSQAVVLRGTLRPGHPQAGMPVAVKFIFRSRGMAKQVRQAFEASGLAGLGGHGGSGGSASSTSSSSGGGGGAGGGGGGSDTSSPPPILDMHYELTPQSPRIKEMPTEIRVLSTLSHPNLIRYIAHFTDATFYYLILELAGPLVAWSECVADHAWNTEAPQRGFGDAMSAPGSPRLGSRSMSSVSLASLAAALSPANAMGPGMAPPALAHRGSTSLTLPESAAIWGELALLASPAVTSPVHESFASYLSNELELPPLPLWKTSRDLFECLDRFGPFCEDRARLVFAQLVDVVAYLHANNICHRDLKDENILINDRLEIKLIDFGSATTLDSMQHGSFGTECYNAPEAVKSERKPCTRHTSGTCALCYDAAKAECWALGVVLYVMLNVSTPYDSAQDSLILPAKPYRRPLSEAVKTVISRLLRREPEKRWGIKDVQECKWLKGVKPLRPLTASGAAAGGVDPAHVQNALGLVAEHHGEGSFSR
ncbi:kinase-like domain-containing protein [Catenaria anguillulae PL171]|uniref:Kinase-like domain-containing protein n=1 Tax=Catenaria anguillulae PL171 TaxID=765915 RepID=A0A1Y2HLJ5_9FUNG|nr:kinase-like domain-containing protein [Catenaria anguillulae PL171]